MNITWGLVIAVSAFLIEVVVYGVSLAFGIYVIELQKEFDQGLSLISAIGSIHFGFQLSAGPLASFLMRKTSYRRVCLLGALLSSIGLSALPFTPNLPYLIVFYGVFTGLGYCFLYIPSHTLSGLWFEQKRGLVTGVVFSGSSLGGVVFPFINKDLIEVYGWRGSMFIIAAVNLQTFILAGLLRESPIQREWKKTKSNTVNTDLSESTTTVFTVHDVSENSIGCDGSIITNERCSHKARKMTKDPVTKAKSTLLQLLTNGPYVLFTINNFLWNIGTTLMLLLGPDYYTKIDLSLTQAATLMSIFQGTKVCGSVAGGFLGNHHSINRCLLCLSTNFVTGLCITVLTLPVLHNMLALALVNSLYGLSAGITLSLTVTLVSDFVGSRLIGDGMGYLMLACGVGCFIGPPVGGYLRQQTDSYESAFYFAGLSVLLSGIVMLIIPIRDCFKRSNKYSISGSSKPR
ncbi:monocarboxylate transporter 13-like isoform X1 [Crassostrea angulata]|uniref:monocarboxylate transporter 13-like isoform X1 n=1 Tax=Magallana angulata TaxID=2784310 RepID=UPI0022B1808D|nr:monocarboxylate transporter 13-like isoform X1 [Crassostrea angulata]